MGTMGWGTMGWGTGLIFIFFSKCQKKRSIILRQIVFIEAFNLLNNKLYISSNKNLTDSFLTL